MVPIPVFGRTALGPQRSEIYRSVVVSLPQRLIIQYITLVGSVLLELPSTSLSPLKPRGPLLLTVVADQG